MGLQERSLWQPSLAGFHSLGRGPGCPITAERNSEYRGYTLAAVPLVQRHDDNTVLLASGIGMPNLPASGWLRALYQSRSHSLPTPGRGLGHFLRRQHAAGADQNIEPLPSPTFDGSQPAGRV